MERQFLLQEFILQKFKVLKIQHQKILFQEDPWPFPQLELQPSSYSAVFHFFLPPLPLLQGILSNTRMFGQVLSLLLQNVKSLGPYPFPWKLIKVFFQTERVIFLRKQLVPARIPVCKPTASKLLKLSIPIRTWHLRHHLGTSLQKEETIKMIAAVYKTVCDNCVVE